MGARIEDSGDDKDGGKKYRGKGGRVPAPWERQESESVGEFHAFVAYRDLPHRTVSEAAKICGRQEAYMAKLSRKWGWQVRSSAWDNELDRRIQDAEASELVKMRKRQIQVGIGLQTAAAKELQALIRKIELADNQAQIGGFVREPLLQPRDLVRLLEAGAKLERVNRGEPDMIVATKAIDEDLHALSLDELKTYKTLLEKMSGKGEPE